MLTICSIASSCPTIIFLRLLSRFSASRPVFDGSNGTFTLSIVLACLSDRPSWDKDEQLTCHVESRLLRGGYLAGLEGLISTRLTVVRSGMRRIASTTAEMSSGAIFHLAPVAWEPNSVSTLPGMM